MASTDELLFGLKKKTLYEQYIETPSDKIEKPESYILNDSLLNYDILVIHYINNNGFRYCSLIPSNIRQANITNSYFTLGANIPGVNSIVTYEIGTHWSQTCMFTISEDGKTITQTYAAELRLRPGSKTDSGGDEYNLRIEKVVGLKFI